MSRIERYQESINKFIKSKDCFTQEIKDILLKKNHLAGILFATLLNHNTKKTNFKAHGYYIVCALDLLTEIIDNPKLSKNTYSEYLILINNLINLNIETIKVPQNKEDVLNKIIFFTYSYINSKLHDIVKTYEFTPTKKVQKTDITSITYLDIEIINKYKSLCRLEETDLEQFNQNTYGNLGEIVFIVGWALGGGDKKPELMKKLQTIGDKFGLIYKLCRDFDNVEEDIRNADKYSYNSIINLGVQETFINFMEIKTQLIEESLNLNIYTHTFKEVLDELETDIDKCLQSASIDMKSCYSSYSK